jgi:hypothetical protein
MQNGVEKPMNTVSKQLLYWAPRALCMLFIAFVSMFALDVFGEGEGFWRTLAALAIHLVPSFVMLAALILAWRWEWIGAVLFAAIGIFFGMIVRGGPITKAMFVLPSLLTAVLFLWNWMHHSDLRAR